MLINQAIDYICNRTSVDDRTLSGDAAIGIGPIGHSDPLLSRKRPPSSSGELLGVLRAQEFLVDLLSAKACECFIHHPDMLLKRHLKGGNPA